MPSIPPEAGEEGAEVALLKKTTALAVAQPPWHEETRLSVPAATRQECAWDEYFCDKYSMPYFMNKETGESA